MLSDSESDGETLQQLTINEHFAKAYARKKEREELTKLKEKYGSDVESILDESEDSEDTEEDEYGEELTPAVDAAILRTLARIKRKDPDIYDSKKDVFEEEQERTKGSFSFNSKKEDKSKPLLLRQHILHSQLQSTSRSPSPEPSGPTHAEEQAALRKETISVFHSAVTGDAEAEDADDILIPREKTKDEIEREEEEYRAFLAREVGEDISGLVSVERTESSSLNDEKENVEDGGKKVAERDSDKDDKKRRKKKGRERKSKEQEDHEFLMSYILNRGWIDKSAHRVPKYEEVTGSKGKKKGRSDADEGEEESDAGRIDIIGEALRDNEADEFDEEEFDEVAETFESSYNFRFEEPDAAQIATHPREISSTVRREENPRKAARERKKQREEEKILQKREEVKRLKALKMKEIREKLERIGKEGGKSADDEALQQLDLEGDWDPEVHDKQMAGIYGGDESESEEGADVKKPTWDDDIDITAPEPEPQPEAGSSKKKKKDKKKAKKDSDDEGQEGGVDIDEMDADRPSTSNTNSKSRVSKKALDEAMDDVYALEFNDMVGDLPTRFKYTPVLPDSYGLSATEILLADDPELNDLVGLRKVAAPYRKDRGRAWDPRRKEKLNEFRKKLVEKKGLDAITGPSNDAFGGDGQGGATGMKSRRKGKKERQKAKLADAIMTENGSSTALPNSPDDTGVPRTEGSEPASKKRKRRRRKSSGES